MTSIVEGPFLDQQRLKSGLSLLFAAGERPSIDEVDAVLRGDGGEGGNGGDGTAAGLPGAMISHRPIEDEGWVELLASGLTFELHGLSPAPAMPVTTAAHAFGFNAACATDLEAVALVTGPHIAGGRAMIPVVRSITGLAANLALALPVQAVCWEPADSWMEPRYFARAIIAWLAGGPFPVLGLTAMVGRDGFVTSKGLGFFSGQEVRVAARHDEPLPETVKLAVRVVDNIVRRGPILQRTEFDAPSGAALIAEPSADGRSVTVWRGH